MLAKVGSLRSLSFYLNDCGNGMGTRWMKEAMAVNSISSTWCSPKDAVGGLPWSIKDGTSGTAWMNATAFGSINKVTSGTSSKELVGERGIPQTTHVSEGPFQKLRGSQKPLWGSYFRKCSTIQKTSRKTHFQSFKEVETVAKNVRFGSSANTNQKTLRKC